MSLIWRRDYGSVVQYIDPARYVHGRTEMYIYIIRPAKS